MEQENNEASTYGISDLWNNRLEAQNEALASVVVRDPYTRARIGGNKDSQKNRSIKLLGPLESKPKQTPKPEKFREAILEKLEAENIPSPGELKVETTPEGVKVKLTFFDRPNVTLCSSEARPKPEQVAKDIKTLARRKQRRE